MSRLFLLLGVLSLFVGCYPEPKLEPVEPTKEHIERMKNAVHGDGSPMRKRPPEGSRRGTE